MSFLGPSWPPYIPLSLIFPSVLLFPLAPLSPVSRVPGPQGREAWKPKASHGDTSHLLSHVGEAALSENNAMWKPVKRGRAALYNCTPIVQLYTGPDRIRSEMRPAVKSWESECALAKSYFANAKYKLQNAKCKLKKLQISFTKYTRFVNWNM